MAFPAHSTTLEAIARRLGFGSIRGDGSVAISSVTLDSRQVAFGSLFCALDGQVKHGREFAGEALSRGAEAVLVEGDSIDDLSFRGQLIVPLGQGRAAVAQAACELYGDPSASVSVVGITGTNGKTTTAYALGHILRVAGWEVRVLGTLTGERTTPEAPELQEAFAEVRRRGELSMRRSSAVLEVSSHALAQSRVEGTKFALSIFTNLSRDHLDFHRDMESYLAVKATLFTPELSSEGLYLLEDEHGQQIAQGAQIPMRGVSLDEIAHLELGLGRSSFTWRERAVVTRFTGRLNVMNLLLAAEAAVQLGVDPALVLEGLSSCPPVPGRFELLEGHPKQPVVVVDYAHTPASVSAALIALRELIAARTAVVIGCGGARDEGKRAEMARAAVDNAEVVVITTDNPRNEDPMAIVTQMLTGLSQSERELKVIVELDRARAIEIALESAGPDGLVAILGKGHESYQEIGAERLPFDDRLVAAEMLARFGTER
ncbi:MAG: UDP-N-acetylmuramoyl-L-alanyl-D-glutamate--2,6-diaminopimelate ligase [Actinomycetes bacterium]